MCGCSPTKNATVLVLPDMAKMGRGHLNPPDNGVNVLLDPGPHMNFGEFIHNKASGENHDAQ